MNSEIIKLGLFSVAELPLTPNNTLDITIQTNPYFNCSFRITQSLSRWDTTPLLRTNLAKLGFTGGRNFFRILGGAFLWNMRGERKMAAESSDVAFRPKTVAGLIAS